MVHELGEDGLLAFMPWVAAITTELAVTGDVRYLAVWRVEASVTAAAGSAWERVKRAAAPSAPFLYVPAFSLMRPVVRRLGARLTETQPLLELTEGFEGSVPRRPALIEVGGGRPGRDARGGPSIDPGFGPLSPGVVGRADARTLAHFVYLAVEAQEAKELRSIEYELEAVGEEFLFIPAVWDPRYIHESNWRLLLSEFDGLVA